jgi:DNA-binding XRE family transcriptional regulator
MTNLTPQIAIARLVERGWKRIQIAADIGVAKGTISKIEAGAMNPSFVIGQKLVNLANSRRKPPRPEKAA